MDFWHDLKHREHSNALLTPLRCVRVAVGNFLQDHRRNKGITLRQGMLPPLMRDLLVGRDEQITAWPGCPVADDACFNVYRWFHANVSKSESLTLGFTCCRKPQRRRSEGWRQSGASPCWALDLARGCTVG